MTDSGLPTPGNGQADECVTLVATASLPTRYGTFTSYAFRVSGSDAEHLALVMGDVTGEQSVLTRLHSECLTGDVFGSYRCDCGRVVLPIFVWVRSRAS